jgi:cell wall-associated NlpC family hydrolase
MVEEHLMMRNEETERRAVVAEAKTWLGTPYHNCARIKSGGVDCGMLLAEVFERAGVIPHVEVEPYPTDWHMHRSEEIYLGIANQFAHPIEGPPQPGDIALYKFGRCVSHGAIVIQWPQILHAYVHLGVILDDAEANSALTSRFYGFYSFWD